MRVKKLIQALVMSTISFCLSGGVDAAIGVSVSGTLDATYPTWNRISNRPNGVGGYVDSANDNVPYEVLEIRTTVPGDILTATVGRTTQFDSFLALYSSFDPNAPMTNLIAADDDSGGYPHAQLSTSGLAANTSYFLVITSYSNTVNSVFPLYGAYSLTLGGSFIVVPPVVAGISPTSGSITGGTQVTITGNHFTGATAVIFGNAVAGFNIDSPTQITATSPAGTDGMIVDIIVTNPGGASVTSQADQFTYATLAAKNMTTNAITGLGYALSAANPGVEIRTLDTPLVGNFIINKNLVLNGGFDATYQIKSGVPTTLNGSLTVTGGASNVETVAVKGKLAVQGGSLRVKDVKALP